MAAGAPNTTKWFEVAGIICVPPIGVQHDLGELQTALLHINKYGDNFDIDTTTDPEDIWDGHLVTTLHPGVQPLASATLESGSGNDDFSGTGAQTVEVIGVGGSTPGYILTTEEVTLDGTNLVALANNYRAIFRMEVLTQGSAGPNVGLLTAKIGSVTVAQILPDNGQTLMAWYIVPEGKTGYLMRWYAKCGKQNNAYAKMSLRVRKWALGGARNAGVTKRADYVHSNSSGLVEKFIIAPVYPARTVIWVRVDEVSASNTAVSAGFDLLTLTNIG